MTVRPSGKSRHQGFDEQREHPRREAIVVIRSRVRHMGLALFALFPFMSGAWAQEGASPKESLTEAELRDHIFFLASDSLRGREPSSDGFRLAAEYAAVHLGQAGLRTLYTDSTGAPSYFQNLQMVISRVSRSANLVIRAEGSDRVLTVGDDFRIREMMATGADRSVEGTPVFIGFGIEEPDLGWNDFEGLDLEGRVAVMVAGTPTRSGEPILPGKENRIYGNLMQSMGRRTESAMSRGVTSLIIVPEQGDTEFWDYMAYRFRGPLTRVAIEGLEAFPVPAMSEVILLRPETAGWLLSGTGFDRTRRDVEYRTGPMEGVHLSLSIPHDVEPYYVSPNVVGFLPGTDPLLRNEYIVVTAHLDHLGAGREEVFNGADDNASGSAAVLEVAEAMAMNPGRRSVLFVLLTAEEMGLLGSFAFTRSPPVPTEDMVLNINLDMVGRDSPGYPANLLALRSENGGTQLLDLIRQVNEEVGAPLDWDLDERVDSQDHLERSDQFAFMKEGIPAILITRGFEGQDYHSATDDPETINYQKVLHATRLTLALVQEAANRNKLEFDRMK